MKTRVNVQATEPAAFKAMFGLEAYLKTSKLTPIQLHLIKIRASQINGCAFCIDMHTKEALKDGETQQRIFLLNAWEETTLYTEEERVILAITEEVTLLTKAGLTDKTYSAALAMFDENFSTQIIMAVVAINGWNRIAISTHLPVQQ
jgi:AhpD family alkylhydroperoxidase